MSAERNLYRQAGTMAGRRLHHQHTPDASCTVLDRDRTQSQPIQFIPGITPGEAEAFAVIVDNEHNLGVILPQFYHDMRGASMLFYVVECFPVNLKEFAANAVRQIEHGRVDQEVQGDAGFIAEALGGAAHQFHQIGALHALRAHVHDHAAQFLGFVAHGVLQGAQLGGHLFGGVRQAAAEDVELDLDAEQSLENAVVEVAGDAAAFAFDGAHAQAAEQEQIFERRAKVAHDAFQPMQILRKLRAAGIGEHQPAHGVAVEIHGNPEHGTHAKLLNGLVGHARQFAEVLRSEEHTSELQSPVHLVCRLLLEKKKHKTLKTVTIPLIIMAALSALGGVMLIVNWIVDYLAPFVGTTQHDNAPPPSVGDTLIASV